MTLKAKSARSSVIVTGMTSCLQLFHMISTILLARMLDPAHFGIMATANLVIMGMAVLAGLGLSQALIATKGDAGKAALQVLYMTSTIGAVLSLVMFALAGSFSNFFEQPDLRLVCQVLSIVVLIQAVKIVPDALLVKDMLFSRRVMPSISASLTGIAVSLSLASAGFGVWSLVLGFLSSSVVATVGLVMVVPSWTGVRKASWSWTEAKSLLRLGSHNLYTWITQYIYNNLDHMVIAKALGARQLGFYSQAFTLSNMVVTTLSAAVNSVLLPAYSKISGDNNRLRSAYLDSLRVMAALTIPIALGIFVIAPEAIIVLIGEKWREAIPILQVFAFMSLVRPLSGTTSPLFISVSQPHYNFRTALIQAAVLALLIIPALQWETVGVAIVVVTAFCAGYAHNIYVACRKLDIGLRVRDIFRQLWPSLIAAMMMASTVEGVKSLIASRSGPIEDLSTLLAVIGVGCLTYIVSLFIVKRELAMEIYKLLTGALTKTRN